MKNKKIKKRSIVLPDVSLCAIVRDEKMNPAGGIERFIESHVPYVDEAVIVDTGSIDGTREILEELSCKYKNMHVYDKKFKGFDNARNYSLKKAKCKWILCLDADELLTHKKPQNDWKVLKKLLDRDLAKVYGFDFLAIPPNGLEYLDFDSHPLRLFNINSHRGFMRSKGEKLIYLEEPFYLHDTVVIKHFVPSQKALKNKRIEWYSNSKYLKIPPSQTKGFSEWKEYNAQRDNYE